MDDKTIAIIRERLVPIYHPLSMYLFGSQAWGQPREDSDVDIYVVIGESNEKTYSLIQKGSLALWDLKFPVDLIVNTKSVFEERRKYKSSLAYQIAAKGVKIYEAA